MYCFDTDVVSASMRHDVPLQLVRRLAAIPSDDQVTTAITLGELVYGAARRGSAQPAGGIRELVASGMPILPFDRVAAETYGPLRAELEREGRRLNDADLQIASIALSRDLTLVTGNVRHFARVPGLRVEDWLTA